MLNDLSLVGMCVRPEYKVARVEGQGCPSAGKLPWPLTEGGPR